MLGSVTTTASPTESTLAAAGPWRLPAEWESHAHCLMAWPTRREIWGEHFAEVKADYARLARTIARFEPLQMIANPRDAFEVSSLCGPTVSILELTIDDSWARDSGPIFLVDDRGGRTASAWRFTAWGGKYTPHDQDALLARRVAEPASWISSAIRSVVASAATALSLVAFEINE